MKFVNTATPYLKVYNPVTGGFASFVAGVLELEPDDPDFDWVKAEAERNPAISIHEHASTCDQCGDVFTGRTAAANLGQHRKQIHFDVWQAEKDHESEAAREVQIKSRSGSFCEVCVPLQEFPNAGELAAHVRLLHANAPRLTESGETAESVDQPDGGGGAPVDPIPAATASGSDT